MVNEHGSVEIQGGPADKLAVTLAKKVWRRKEEDARRTAGDLNLIIKDDGGKVIVEGTPEQVAKSNTSATAAYLRKALSRARGAARGIMRRISP